MVTRIMTAGGELPLLIGVLCALQWIGGCTTYDTKLLEFDPEPATDAAVKDMTLPPMRPDARASDPAVIRDGGSGHTDARRQPDTATVDDEDAGADAEDAALDSGMPTGAGCSDSDNPDGDCCPDDPDKTDPGVCGCGVADVDIDHDEMIDCGDKCPNDADKTEPGTCGCGLPDQDSASFASCVGLESALVHRYRFDGNGTRAADSVGGAHGTVVNAQLTGVGKLALAGGATDQYVDLPNAMLSTLTDATIEVWVTWSGGTPWQRVFDFGDTVAGVEGTQESGRSGLFLTPAMDTGGMRATLRDTTGAEVVVNGAALASNTPKHIAVVVDDTHDLLSLYVDGALVMSAAMTLTLASVNDVNSWLGRSQYMIDDELGATLHEFRIYNAALSASQLATSFAAGPDPAFLPH